MLKAASSALGIGAHEAMRLAEALYLAGYLSYPRTESTAYPPGTDLGAPLRAQTADARWGGLAQQLLKRWGGAHAGGPPPARGGVDAGDHPPITPVLAADGGLPGGGDGRRIYELVA
jgi:DNA topoisomerase III